MEAATKEDLSGLKEDFRELKSEWKEDFTTLGTELKNDLREVLNKLDKLLDDHVQLSKSVSKLQGKFFYLNWLFGIVIVFVIGAIGRIAFFPNLTIP